MRAAGIAVLTCLLVSGCMLLDVREQQARLDETCTVRGTVTSAREEVPIVVVLFRRVESERRWDIVDHFVLQRPGRWGFAAGPGRYAAAAFEDRTRDLLYQPGEPYGTVAFDTPVVCTPGARLDGLSVSLPAQVKDPFPHTLDIVALQRRGVADQTRRTLGQLTAVGEVISLSDERFSQQHAESALWRPVDFLLNSWAGVYFLEPYDARKLPVLFVHGISGTPAGFAYLVERLDRSRYQPWVYYYPSGVHLASIADHLDQTMAKLQLRHRFSRFVVVAHSMGGLVSRGYIQRHARNGHPARIPLFVSISTPWGGHAAAEKGVKSSPIVVDVWRDMAPGSEYQRSLYVSPLPAGTPHHLLFTFNRKNASFGESDDHSVTVASQLLPRAQREAQQIYGFDDTHTGVLRNAEVSLLLNQLLDRVQPPSR